MMITLKAVLVGSSCVGVLAVGGGVTYATVAHPHAGLRAEHSKVAVAKPSLNAPVPGTSLPPVCLPKAGLPKAGAAQHALPAPAVPQAGAVQQAADEAKRAVSQQAQRVDAAGKVSVSAPAVPAVPHCLPAVPPKVELPAHPAKPQLPKLPHGVNVSCDTVKPAIALGSEVERSVILSRGLGHGTKKVEVVTHKVDKLRKDVKVCKVTEKWVGAAGQWLKVERIKVPQPYGLDQLSQALQLPAGGVPVSLHGVRAWQTPLGSAVLWYSEDGFALCVEASTAYAPQVQDVAAKLQQQVQRVR
jgi:hypothetical protein